MVRDKARTLVVSLVSVVTLAWTFPAAAELRLAVLPRLAAVELTRMFTPLADYLSRETGEKVTIVVPKDFDALKSVVRGGQAELGFANSLVYVQMRKDQQLEPLALASEPKAGTRFRGIIIARADSGISTVRDLKGKRLIFVEPDSAAGHVFQIMLLSKAGLDVTRDFTMLPFARKHDNVTMAVFNRAADAGGIREDDLEKMKAKVDLSQMRVVAYTDYFPNWPLFATTGLPREKAERIRAALLRLRPGAAESTTVLGAAHLTGFAPVSDKDYDTLREAAKLAGVY